MTNALETLTSKLIDAAKRAGAEHVDALAVEGISQSIDVLNGKLEHAERAEGIDIGLRVLIGQRQACVSASDISEETLTNMAERAVAMAKEAPEDPYVGLAAPEQLATSWDLEALELADPQEEPDPAALQDAALAIEAAALSNAGVTQVSSSSAGFGKNAIHLAASNGFSGGYARSHHSLSCVAISGTGAQMERDYEAKSRVFRSDLPSAEVIGETASLRAVERQGVRRPPSGNFPVLFDERISSSLIGHLLGAINGSTIARGSSWLLDAMGTQILPQGVDLIENPLRPRIFGSRPFDGEGLASKSRNIVSNGVLNEWTLDLATARKLGMTSTGSAARGTSSPPGPSITNVTLSSGRQTRDELLAQMGTGLMVTSLIGSTINPTTGDYSRGASGFWIENGEISYPVNECTIAGNLRDMLKSFVAANDSDPFSSYMVPSLLVERLTIAGA